MFPQRGFHEPRVFQRLLSGDPPSGIVGEETREEVLPLGGEEWERGTQSAVWLDGAEAAGAEQLAGAA